METIFTVTLPLKRIPKPCLPLGAIPWHWRWFGWLFSWGGGSIQEFGGNRINTVRHLQLFRWHVLTIRWNEYHDRSWEEKAEEYLRKWHECEKELQGYRLLLLGDKTGSEVKKVIRQALGVDLDEGRIL